MLASSQGCVDGMPGAAFRACARGLEEIGLRQMVSGLVAHALMESISTAAVSSCQISLPATGDSRG
ncbi:MAG: hypothetical protein GY696_04480 [Gammaproteobacteria bacterium]|nr:hypothetical protein [Gammaproteobacteria bacterium]